MPTAMPAYLSRSAQTSCSAVGSVPGPVAEWGVGPARRPTYVQDEFDAGPRQGGVSARVVRNCEVDGLLELGSLLHDVFQHRPDADAPVAKLEPPLPASTGRLPLLRQAQRRVGDATRGLGAKILGSLLVA